MARGNFGERLKRERELREVPPEEVAVATRIAPRYLQALENEDWEKLPGGVFNRGFVRSIARYLGLDEESLLAEYDLAHSAHAQLLEQNKIHKAEERIPQMPSWVPVALVLGAILVLAGLIVGGVYGWRRYKKRHPSVNAAFIVPGAGPNALLLKLNREGPPPAGADGSSSRMMTKNLSRQMSGGNSQP